MVKKLTTSMMIDSIFMKASLHTLAEIHISDGKHEKGDRGRREDQILHIYTSRSAGQVLNLLTKNRLLI